ncbi:MAG: hypothetical protein EOM68_00110 [Spirochaetia bacterium]|nr:hypothetical protein [Spirochaetia bacterium]
MCWKPKIKTPNIKMPQQAPAAAPVVETPAAVQFGDEDDSSKSSEKGVASVTIKPEAENQNNTEASTNFGAPIPTGSKSTGQTFSKGLIGKATASAIRK